MPRADSGSTPGRVSEWLVRVGDLRTMFGHHPVGDSADGRKQCTGMDTAIERKIRIDRRYTWRAKRVKGYDGRDPRKGRSLAPLRKNR